MSAPYWTDGQVTLYLGDCREVTEWLAADVLVTDPPYGRGWKQGRHWDPKHADDSHGGIAGDTDTAARDDMLGLWGGACPPGVIADPFAGAGSTLVAARNQGHPAIGVELEERYCEQVARRLDQPVMDFGEVVA